MQSCFSARHYLAQPQPGLGARPRRPRGGRSGRGPRHRLALQDWAKKGNQGGLARQAPVDGQHPNRILRENTVAADCTVTRFPPRDFPLALRRRRVPRAPFCDLPTCYNRERIPVRSRMESMGGNITPSLALHRRGNPQQSLSPPRLPKPVNPAQAVPALSASEEKRSRGKAKRYFQRTVGR